MHFRKIGYLGGPVIHLHIDVGGVIAAPWWPQFFVPDALQIGWHTGCTGTGN